MNLSTSLLRIEKLQGNTYEWTYQVFGLNHPNNTTQHIQDRLENSFPHQGIILSRNDGRNEVSFTTKGVFLEVQQHIIGYIIKELEDISEELNIKNIHNNMVEVKRCIKLYY